MSAPPYVPVPATDKPRRYESPPWRPEPWVSHRPADLTRQPTGPRLGHQGPDQGFVLRLFEHVEPEIVLAQGEHLADVVAGCAAVALKRASLFGRAPVIHDVRIALDVWGYRGQAPQALVDRRRPLFAECHHLHHYMQVRSIVDQVPESVLRLTPAEVAQRAAGDWSSVLAPATVASVHHAAAVMDAPLVDHAPVAPMPVPAEAVIAPAAEPEPVVEVVAEPEPVVEAVVEPEPVVEAVVEPEPEIVPEPVVEAVVEPEPEIVPAPVAEVVEPEPVAAADPAPVAEVVEPEPVAAADPAPVAEVVEPEPVAAADPAPAEAVKPSLFSAAPAPAPPADAPTVDPSTTAELELVHQAREILEATSEARHADDVLPTRHHYDLGGEDGAAAQGDLPPEQRKPVAPRPLRTEDITSLVAEAKGALRAKQLEQAKRNQEAVAAQRKAIEEEGNPDDA